MHWAKEMYPPTGTSRENRKKSFSQALSQKNSGNSKRGFNGDGSHVGLGVVVGDGWAVPPLPIVQWPRDLACSPFGQSVAEARHTPPCSKKKKNEIEGAKVGVEPDR